MLRFHEYTTDGILVLLYAICFLTRHTSAHRHDPGFVTGGSSEYCDWEWFDASCQSDQVIVIHSARYGRMRMGRCVTKNYGHIGCGSDVTSHFERNCSGKHQCKISVISLHSKRMTCPPDLKSYLEISYECITVFNRVSTELDQENNCQSLSALRLPPPVGFIASIISVEMGLGTTAVCPWSISVAPNQRINITMIDFAVEPNTSETQNLPGVAAKCIEYAAITEGRTAADNSSAPATWKIICGRRWRESVVYVSRSNYVEIQIRTDNLTEQFLLNYEAFGCGPIVAPSGAWVTLRSNEEAIIRCNESNQSWHLTCFSREWIGEYGLCQSNSVSHKAAAAEEDTWAAVDRTTGSDGDMLFGVLVIVSFGIIVGVIVGVFLLVSVLLYQKRYRQRKIRCRFTYMTKKDLCSGPVPAIHDYPNVMESGGSGKVVRKPSPCKLPPIPVDHQTLQETRCGSLGSSSVSSSSQAQEMIDRNLLPLPPHPLSSVSFASNRTNHERLLVDCNIKYASEEEKKSTSFKPCEHSANDIQVEYYSLEGFGGKRRHGIEGHHSQCSIVDRVSTRYDSADDAGLDGLRRQTDNDVDRRHMEIGNWGKTKSGSCRKPLQSPATDGGAPYYFKLDPSSPSSSSFILTPASGHRNSEPTEDDDDRFTNSIEVNSEHC